MCSLHTILVHEMLAFVGNEPDKYILDAAMYAASTAKSFGKDISSKDLAEVIERVFYHLGDFPYDPAWVGTLAFHKYKLEFGYTEV